MIKLPYIGMVNIIAKRKIIPEFIQYQAKPKAICSYIINTLIDPRRLDTIKKLLSETRKSLGEPGATQKAAAVVLSYLES